MMIVVPDYVANWVIPIGGVLFMLAAVLFFVYKSFLKDGTY